MDKTAEAIATAPKAKDTSESPQIAITTASADATLATTADQTTLRLFISCLLSFRAGSASETG
jgi:hypothetical protein